MLLLLPPRAISNSIKNFFSDSLYFCMAKVVGLIQKTNKKQNFIFWKGVPHSFFCEAVN